MSYNEDNFLNQQKDIASDLLSLTNHIMQELQHPAREPGVAVQIAIAAYRIACEGSDDG